MPPTLPGIIKSITLPNGVERKDKKWTYKFSLCLQFAKVDQAEAHLDKIFRNFSSWIPTFAGRNFFLHLRPPGVIPDSAPVLKVQPVGRPRFDKDLWDHLFNVPRKTANFTLRREQHKINPLFSETWQSIKDQYPAADDETHHAWNHARLNYLLNQQAISAASLKQNYSATRSVTDRLKTHQRHVHNYHHAHITGAAAAGSTGFDPFKVLSFLVDKYEINRRLGLILDFELKDSNELEYLFPSGTVEFNISTDLLPAAGTLDEYLDDTLHSQMGCYGTGGASGKRIIYMSAINAAGQPQSKFGLLQTKDALVTKTEILSDILSNADNTYTLSLHAQDISAGDPASAWAEPLIVNSNPGVTKGLYLYMPNLAAYTASGNYQPGVNFSFMENHVLLGHKAGVIRDWDKDNKPGNIFSLCARQTSYDLLKAHTGFLENPFKEKIGERAIRLGTGVATKDDQGNEAVNVDEKFFLWTGESLVIKSLFSALDGDPAPGTANVDPNRDVLNNEIKTTDKYLAMPKLRFDDSYSFVVAGVLLNGWSIPFAADPDQHYQGLLKADEGQLTVTDLFGDTTVHATDYYTSKCRFSRLEPVGSPVLVPNNANFRQGESLSHLITRNGQPSIRYIVPRSVSGVQAIWHRNLDTIPDIGLIKRYIDGPDARSLKTLETEYAGVFEVPYLGDPLAVNIAFSFYADPAGKFPMTAGLTVYVPPDRESVHIEAKENYIVLYNAFDPRDWPSPWSWQITIQPADRMQDRPLAVNFIIPDRSIVFSVKPGAEIFCETHFLYRNGNPAYIAGQRWQDKGLSFQDRMTSQNMGAAEFVKQKKAFYPATKFTLTHAIQQPVVPPAYLLSSDNNIKGAALLGIRQMLFPGSNNASWSTKFEEDNLSLPLYFKKLFPLTGLPLLSKTQVRVLDFVHFEHLNGEMMTVEDNVAPQPSTELAKTGSIRIYANWNEYVDDSGAQHPNGYAAPLVRQAQFEYGYELSRMQGNSAASLTNCDDLQVSASHSRITYVQTAAATAANIFSCWASKLCADIEQHDTKFRKKQIYLQGVSKFPYAFYAGIKPMSGPASMLIVPSNAKPVTISVHKIIPLIDRLYPQDYLFIKRGNSFRIYLKGDWWNTGAEERLGILCLNPKPGRPPLSFTDYQYYFSKIGRDITSANSRIDNTTGGLLKWDDFVEFFQQSCVGNTIELLKGNLTKPDVDNWPGAMLVPMEDVFSGLCAWIVTPKFDDNEKKWFVDVTLREELSNASHASFVQLNLVRFQPFGLNYNEGDPSIFIRKLFSSKLAIDDTPPGYVPDPAMDFRISPFLLSPAFYLHPTRKITTTHHNDNGHFTIRIDLDAASVKQANGVLLTEFWVCQQEIIGKDVLQTDQRTWKRLSVPADISGNISYVGTITNFSNKIVLKEFECYPNDDFQKDIESPMDDRNRREVFSQFLRDPKMNG